MTSTCVGNVEKFSTRGTLRTVMISSRGGGGKTSCCVRGNFVPSGVGGRSVSYLLRFTCSS